MQFSDPIFFNLGEGFGGVAMMRCGQLLGASQCRGGVAASCLGWWLRPPPKCSRALTRAMLTRVASGEHCACALLHQNQEGICRVCFSRLNPFVQVKSFIET